MKKLLKFEFRRLFGQLSFYICLGILALITLFQIRNSWNMQADMGLDGTGFVQQSLINSGTTFLFIILLSIFSALFISEDYSGGTIRNIITRGYSRTEIYFSKLIVLLCGAMIMLVVCWITAYATAKVVYDGSYTSMRVVFLLCMLAQILVIAAYTCLFNATASAIQKTGGSLAVCIVLPITVSLILTLLETSASLGASGDEVELAKYWLEYILSSISIVDVQRESLRLALIAAPIYITVTTAAGWLLVFKREY